ncbi:hypothetical protein [Hymenobacter latericus]|uniref:hypothetical protein n=1 Tax=Hymenobacter sp. YIM 151858-1 TaxID=2987688 RepID=UPI0022275147|nr:hypothetical protein [Hymenobacter sp. YIM 151858-1]UYZ60129.1 hypothetical protein OIS50_04835 [Hymenobacter sp. YIM 151858-1]
MATITNLKQTFTYRGSGLLLTEAAFLGNVEKIFRMTAQGNFAPFVPGSAFNAFTRLDDGVAYVLFSKQVPYEIPTTEAKGAPTEFVLLSELT